MIATVTHCSYQQVRYYINVIPPILLEALIVTFITCTHKQPFNYLCIVYLYFSSITLFLMPALY